MLTTLPARLLRDDERGAVERVLDADPFAGAQVAERVSAGGLSVFGCDAKIFGYGARRHLESICWLGANLIPVRAGGPAVAAFAELAGAQPHACSSLVGESEAVLGLWSRLVQSWGPARDVRPCQPLMVTWTPP
ncbi:MAG: DUF4081 domain-containing protein, partial [Micromonosporaceae bacterium]